MADVKKFKTSKDLEAMKAKELNEEVDIREKELYLMKVKHSLNELKQTHVIKKLRRYIARIKTFIKVATKQ